MQHFTPQGHLGPFLVGVVAGALMLDKRRKRNVDEDTIRSTSKYSKLMPFICEIITAVMIFVTCRYSMAINCQDISWENTSYEIPIYIFNRTVWGIAIDALCYTCSYFPKGKLTYQEMTCNLMNCVQEFSQQFCQADGTPS